MSKKNYISIDHNEKYIVVTCELTNDYWSKELLVEIIEVCQKIQDDQDCLSVLFLTNSDNSGLGWHKSMIPFSDVSKDLVNRVLSSIESLRIPSFFLMRGMSFLPAVEVALSCDIRLARDDVSIALMRKNNDVLPSDQTIKRLASFTHRAFALDLLLFQKLLNADQCKQSGLISEIFSGSSDLSEVKNLLTKITSYGPIAIKLLKESISLGADVDLNTALKIEHERTLLLQNTNEFKEGVHAFLKKRLPTFQGK